MKHCALLDCRMLHQVLVIDSWLGHARKMKLQKYLGYLKFVCYSCLTVFLDSSIDHYIILFQENNDYQNVYCQMIDCKLHKLLFFNKCQDCSCQGCWYFVICLLFIFFLQPFIYFFLLNYRFSYLIPILLNVCLTSVLVHKNLQLHCIPKYLYPLLHLSILFSGWIERRTKHLLYTSFVIPKLIQD